MKLITDTVTALSVNSKGEWIHAVVLHNFWVVQFLQVAFLRDQEIILELITSHWIMSKGRTYF